MSTEMMLSRVLEAIIGGAVSIATAYVFLRYLHNFLARGVTDTKVTAEQRKEAFKFGEIEVPSDIIENPQNYRIVHENHEALQRVSIPLDDEKAALLFTQLMRRNMQAFARLPQCWAMRLMCKTLEQKMSFSQTHIGSLNFEKGDLVCGFTQVLNRTPLRVEMSMTAPEGMGDFSGRLICGLERHDASAILSTQTLQWTKVSDPKPFPIEGGAPKFIHELTSWWLLVSGARYLERRGSV